MPQLPHPTAIARTVLTVACISAAGCQAVDNDRLTIAGEPLPVVADSEGHASAPLTEATGPSLTGVDRSNWPEDEIVVWQDGVRHHPHYTSNSPHYANATARQRGEYPTFESSLELGGDGGAQFWEAFSAPVWGGMDVVLFLPRAVMRGPGSIVASPDATYARGNGASAPTLDAAVAPIGGAETK